MRTHHNPLNPSRRAAISGLAVLAGLGLAAPLHAIDRTWNTDFGDWGTQANWSPVGWPAVTDHVLIGNTPATIDAIVNMDVGGTIAALDLVGRAHLNTEGRSLHVNGLARINGNDSGGSSDFYARLRVTNGANPVDFEADSLQILSEGGLNILDNPVVGVNGALTIANDAYVAGNGRLTASGSFSNGGRISVFGGDMTLVATSGVPIDLDGANSGEIIINDAGADLIIQAAALSDAFDNRIFLGGDSALSMALDAPWTMGLSDLATLLANFGATCE